MTDCEDCERYRKIIERSRRYIEDCRTLTDAQFIEKYRAKHGIPTESAYHESTIPRSTQG